MSKRTGAKGSEYDSRRLFVVDIENAIGAGCIDEESCRAVRNRIQEVYKPKNCDLTIIGVSHPNNVLPAACWNRSVRVVATWGHNGADLALDRVLSKEGVEDRFDEVVIVSGDGMFAMQATRLRSLGVKVTVDSEARRLSKRLALSCSSVRLASSTRAA